MVVKGRDPSEYRRNLETWLANPFELDEKWRERARVEVKEDPETVRSNVEALRKLVEGEENLYARTDDLFLLAFLRGRKHNIDEAFKLLKGYYHSRASYPDFFDLCLPSEQREFYNLKTINILEDKDQLDRPVIYFNCDFDAYKVTNKQIAQIFIHVLDILMMDPHVQISGVTVLTNLTGCSVSFNAAYIYRVVWSLFRPFVKEKLRKRNFIYGADELEKIHDHITPDILPLEAAGKKPISKGLLQERLKTIEPYLREWSRYGYNRRPQEE